MRLDSLLYSRVEAMNEENPSIRDSLEFLKSKLYQLYYFKQQLIADGFVTHVIEQRLHRAAILV